MKLLIPIKVDHAADLFPMVDGTEVLETLLWDGPDSFDEFQRSLAEREARVQDGTLAMYAIRDPATGRLVGCADIVEDQTRKSGELGLWIGIPFQGRGLGTAVIRKLTEIGFQQLKLARLEAHVFVGNEPSRRAFERSGFRLQKTISGAFSKKGRLVDQWLMTMTRTD